MKTIKSILFVVALIATVAFTFGCKKSDVKPEAAKTSITTIAEKEQIVTISGAFYGNGYGTCYVTITRNGTIVFQSSDRTASVKFTCKASDQIYCSFTPGRSPILYSTNGGPSIGGEIYNCKVEFYINLTDVGTGGTFKAGDYMF